MSEILWKWDHLQLPSVELLLKEFGDDVNVFNTTAVLGYEKDCGMAEGQGGRNQNRCDLCILHSVMLNVY
jgi:hypothetical protein